MSSLNQILRSWEWRNWSPVEEALDSLTNSPCQDLWKGEENSIEIMHTDVRVHRVNCTNIVWTFATFKGRPPRVKKTCWIVQRVHCLICVKSFGGGDNSFMVSKFPISCQVTRNPRSRSEIVTKRAVSKWWRDTTYKLLGRENPLLI